MKFNDEWRHAILATFRPLDYDKTVSATEWSRAEERTLALARTTPPPVTVAAREEKLQQPALPAPPRPSTAAEKIALNTTTEAFLRHVAARHVILATDSGMLPQQAARARRNLRTLGLIIEERIVAHAGRGGSAVAIAPTAAGYEWAGVAPGGLGGGGLQHRYLVKRISEQIPDARIEYAIGEKRVDIFALNTPAAQPFLDRVRNLAGRPLDFGMGIAIEVETSDPAKTAHNNIAKNAAAGLATITAVLPKHVDAMRRKVPGAIIVDALQLIGGS